MYRKGEVTYQALPLPDRVQKPDDPALADATGFLIAALHRAGLVCLEHTPNPMKFLNAALDRPESEKPVMILPVGWPAPDATVPAAAKRKKPLAQVLSVFR